MKQKRLMGLALASLLVLSGCSSAVKENGKYVVSSIDGKNLLADDLYTKLSQSAEGKNALFSYLLDELVKQNFPVTSDMKEEASEIVKNTKTYYQNQYGDEADTKLDEYFASMGLKDIDAYEDALVQSLQSAEFRKKYVKDHFDDVFEDYYKQESPRYISLIKVAMSDIENPTTEENEKLEEVKSLLKTDKSFADIASEYSDDTTKSAKGNLGIVDSTKQIAGTYGDAVEKEALSLAQGKTTDAIKGEDGYYFLYCSSNDKETIKKELKTVDIESPLLSYDEYMVYLIFKTYDIKYNDESTKKIVDGILEENLKTRDEKRGGQS